MLRLTNPHALAYVPRIETMENLYIFSSFGWKVVSTPMVLHTRRYQNMPYILYCHISFFFLRFSVGACLAYENGSRQYERRRKCCFFIQLMTMCLFERKALDWTWHIVQVWKRPFFLHYICIANQTGHFLNRFYFNASWEHVQLMLCPT